MEPWERLDSASPEEARRLLTTCCGSSAWVDRMLRRCPFGSADALLAAAPEAWLDLTLTDWLEAFSHHPKIGDRTSLAQPFAATAHLSAREQSGAADAPAQVLDDLAAANRTYEEKFGYIFIVCATGKSAGEMLALLRARLLNDPATEIRVAAEEQGKITQLRLQRLG
ncbi:MAG TPA: 2-oxo-4-hydroxy-4-carboxy-5-ureidoimidazoline decarboxylase [Vicinamibacterales bacterium]|nr:2-oxo-4-hydroxy-4-carboxy-5-ureidoimidazoline decarboxylase [Vicinamibacterales bacterium]